VAIGVFVQALRILGISGIGIDAIECAVVLVVVSRAEIILLGIGIELFAGIQQICGFWCDGWEKIKGVRYLF
jgi:hypothetical protein